MRPVDRGAGVMRGLCHSRDPRHKIPGPAGNIRPPPRRPSPVPSAASSPAAAVAYAAPAGRWILLATVLGSSMAMLDGTIVNVALPAIGEDLDAGIAGLQWTVNAYTLTLAAFILLGGAAGDRFGRRRVFLVGVVGFAAASLLCGIAPNIETLVAARALQGVAGALLTPGSLAILQASFSGPDRGRAIGAWSGLGRHRRRRRPVPRRLAGRRRLLALGLPAQRAGGAGRGGGRRTPRAGEPGPRAPCPAPT